MTQSDPNSPLPPPRQLTAGMLLLRTVLGLTVLAIGIYTLTRKPPPDASPPESPLENITPATQSAESKIASPSTNPRPAALAPTPIPKAAAADVLALAFAPDGRLLVARRAGVALHDLSSGSRQPLAMRLPTVRDISFTPGGGTIALAGGEAAPTVIWSVVPASSRNLAAGATAVRFSPDGRTLATGHPGGAVRLWDAISWDNTATLSVDVGPIHALAFAPDGRSIAIAGRGVAVWELPGNRPRIRLGGHCPSVAYSPDGHVLAAAGEDGVTLWETVFWQKLATLAPGQAVTRVAYWRSGTSMVMSLADGSIQLWNPTTRQRTTALPSRGPIVIFALSPDDRTVAAATASIVTLWDTTTHNPRPLP